MIRTAIIEDSNALKKLYQRFLADSDFEINLFGSKPSEIDRLKDQGGFDLIICPGFPKYQSGPHIAQMIKSKPEFSNSAFVISTSMQQERVKLEWDLRDIDTLLLKPFDQKALKRTLANACPARPLTHRKTPLALVIDDSNAVRKRLSSYLIELNFDVQTASDGMEGLQAAGDVLPDLILVDVEMPILNGFDFCAQLSRQADIQHIPTIVISGTIDENQFRKGFRAGAIDFLEKPVSLSSLATIIESVSIGEDNRSDGTTMILSEDSTLASILTKSLNFLSSSINVCSTTDELETYLSVALPDIIILDLSSRSSKLETCRQIRSLLGNESTVIIAVADETDRDIMFQCFKYGATEFIIKPFGRDEVRARIENHIKLKKLQDELVQKNKILESLAYKDKLTGLMNRRFMDNALKDEIAAARTNQSPLSFLMFDLDNFKKVNDDFGHDIGDVVLMEVAAMILDNVTDKAIPCRYGGEEFCIIYPDTPLSEAVENSEKIMRYCSVKPISQHRIYQTLSGGVACIPETSDPDELLVHADTCLYKAKKEGKNRIIARAPKS